jgi:uncharacterized protein
LDQLKQNNQLELYGPFGDGTGGAYVINVASLEEATKIGYSDPLILSGSSSLIIKEWKTK